MILHNLEFEAFMAYPKRQEINFDTLNNAGVFLLNGPTGAGKTTILDAICYALYGETSSDRESAKLHSTYAAHSGTKPRVLLDVTLHGKRLRIDRTPAYNKPITRGARKGQMREESAKATLAELAPGADPADEKAWIPISSSVAEVNRTIAERTHLTKEQFLKVVLLPQGQFAQFLKSKPKERKELLKKMFPVEHYEQLFAALTEEAKTAQQEVAQDENTQRGYLERARAEMLALQSLLDAVDSDAEEAAEAGEETSENLTTENVTAENVTAETLDAWVAGGVERARKTSVREKQEQQRLTNEADRNTRLLAERAQLQADWREYEQLCERRTRLTERADEHKAQREELVQARAAAPCTHSTRRSTPNHRRSPPASRSRRRAHPHWMRLVTPCLRHCAMRKPRQTSPSPRRRPSPRSRISNPPSRKPSSRRSLTPCASCRRRTHSLPTRKPPQPPC